MLYHAANARFCKQGLLWLTTDGCAGGSETEAQWLGTLDSAALKGIRVFANRIESPEYFGLGV